MKKHQLFGVPAAIAAVATGVVVLGAGSSAAAGPGALVPTCDGSEVVTCVFVEVSNGRANARGSITDTAGGKSFQVKLENLRLEHRPTSTSGWDAVRWNLDNDGNPAGYFDNYDDAETSSHKCTGNGPDEYRAIAKFTWRWQTASGWESTSEVQTSPIRLVGCEIA